MENDTKVLIFQQTLDTGSVWMILCNVSGRFSGMNLDWPLLEMVVGFTLATRKEIEELGYIITREIIRL